jgi:hypothetical protein
LTSPIDLDVPVDTWIERFLARPGIAAVPLSHQAACCAYQLHNLAHRDPADRLLIATAIELASVRWSPMASALCTSASGTAGSIGSRRRGDGARPSGSAFQLALDASRRFGKRIADQRRARKSAGERIEIPRQGFIESRCRTSLLTMMSAPPAAASARLLGVLGVAALLDGLSRFDPLRRDDHDVEDPLAALDSHERSNFGRKMTSRNSSSTACERSSLLGALTARSNACSGTLFALRAAETKVEASRTTLKLCSLPAMPRARRQSPHR